MNRSIDKDSFINQASDFFNEIFEPAFNSGYGNIEIRTFKPASQSFIAKGRPQLQGAIYYTTLFCWLGFDVEYGSE